MLLRSRHRARARPGAAGILVGIPQLCNGQVCPPGTYCKVEASGASGCVYPTPAPPADVGALAGASRLPGRR